MITIFFLLVVYQLKHFIADYPLQGQYMLGKFKPGWEFVGPLAAHCLVHSTMTFVIVYAFRPELAFQLAVFDFCMHFAMDRIKASPKLLGRYKAISANEYKELVRAMEMPGNHPEIVMHINSSKKKFKQVMRSNQLFWWALGLDKMVHHLTHYAIIYWVLS